jgi:hypothetical protein
MRTVIEKIRIALDGHLNDMSNKPEIAWENRKYTPKLGTPFIRPQFSQVEAPAAGVGITSPIRRRGVYTVTVFCDKGISTPTLENLAGRVEERFQAGTVLTEDDMRVHILQGSVRNGLVIEDDMGWVYIPIIVDWYAYQHK